MLEWGKLVMCYRAKHVRNLPTYLVPVHMHEHILDNSVLSMVVPIYNAELAPKSLRGRLVSLNQLAITAGIMVQTHTEKF